MQDLLPTPIESRLLSQCSSNGIRHGFFTRQGGVSEGIYASLNVGIGSQDKPGNVLENRRRVAAWFGQPLERLATVHQVHSPDVIVMDDTFDGTRPQADALVTSTPGLVLGVLAADCGPLLFADPQARVIGAAHAGWKGALYGVAENTIATMVALGAQVDRIVAALGPSIGPESYEVGPEYVARFMAEDEARYAPFFTPSQKPGHCMFDLPGLTTQRLLDAGIQAENLKIDTYADKRFFSYRRTTHAGEPDYGRQISAIAIMET